MKQVVIALMFDCTGAPHRLAFDTAHYAEQFAENHGLEISYLLGPVTLDEAERRGYEY